MQQTLIDILRGAAASEEEAKVTAQRLAEKSMGTQFFDRARIQEQFDLVRANRRWRTLQEQPTEKFDPWLCIFADGVACPQCTARARRAGKPDLDELKVPWPDWPYVVHGHLVAEDA